ncbi:uncharacterized protein P884DRAFT_302761 [Thermothelomyces heterothallicus CBS 202.75]|uniref:uncharacterized protein n=1 Tax=Thermothelomyces heterothallicus CBS 202.75 TaxID=1149848 RepID=UPI0037431333
MNGEAGAESIEECGAASIEIKGKILKQKPISVNVTNAAFYNDGPLDQLVVAFDPRRRGGKTKLASFLKRVRVRVRTIHLREKENKAGEVIYRVKTIVGLATPNDGHGLAHPPRVPEFGAIPKLVEFWLDSGSPAEPHAATEASGSQAKKRKGGMEEGPTSQPRRPRRKDGI